MAPSLIYTSGVKKVNFRDCSIGKASCADTEVRMMQDKYGKHNKMCCPKSAFKHERSGRRGRFMLNGSKFCGDNTEWKDRKCVSTVDVHDNDASVVEEAMAKLDKSQFCGRGTKWDGTSCVPPAAVSVHGSCDGREGRRHLKLDEAGTNCAATCPPQPERWSCPGSGPQTLITTLDLSTGCVSERPRCPKPTAIPTPPLP